MSGTPKPATAHSVLRNRTASAHEAVDAAFGRFSLSEAGSYRKMLLAHGSVLPPLEALLREHAGLPAWRARAHLLEADLSALGQTMPQPLAVGADWSEPELHGLLYVLEGSRLGSRMLARGVSDDLPCAFLDAGHEKGEWRALLGVLDDKAAAFPGAWLDAAVNGALRGFALYEAAAARFEA